MSKWDRLLKWLKAGGILFMTLFTLASASWCGDLLLDLSRAIFIFPKWPAGAAWYSPNAALEAIGSMFQPWPDDAMGRIAGATVSAILFGIGSWILYRQRRLILSTQALLLSVAAPRTRQALIIGLSPKGNNEKALKAMKELPIMTTARTAAELVKHKSDAEEAGNTDLAALLTDLSSKPEPPWQQSLRVIWDHVGASDRERSLRSIKVITSNGDGSNKDFEEFRSLLQNRLTQAQQSGHFSGPLPTIETVVETGVDFENYDVLVSTMRRAVDKIRSDVGLRHSEICIDATAGFKTFSIAAAIATLNHQLIFSYVNRNGEPLYFDASIEMGSLGAD